MASRVAIKDYPFLTSEEFQEACHYLDYKYIGATLGPVRRTFKLRMNRNLAGGDVYLSIIRPIDTSGYDITLDLENLTWGEEDAAEDDASMDIDAENADYVCQTRIEHVISPVRSNPAAFTNYLEDALRPRPDERALATISQPLDGDGQLPKYTPVAQQPYVVYEIHLSETYRTPTLFFTLHDLPPLDSKWDLDVVYRYLIPEEFKDQLRAYGPIGAISADCHPITGVPTFRIHPCGTPDAMRPLQCSLKDYLQIWLGFVGPCVGLHVPRAMAEVDL